MKQAKANNGKGYMNWHGDDSIRTNLYVYMNSNRITEEEADIIARELGI